MLDLILNYNDDLDYFWDHNNQKFLIEEYSTYIERQEKYKKEKAAEKLEELDEEYRQLLINKMEDRKEIELTHKQLSQGFGIPIGLAKTLKLNINKSCLDILKDIYNSKELESGLSIKGQLLPNPYLETLLACLSVIVLIHIDK